MAAAYFWYLRAFMFQLLKKSDRDDDVDSDRLKDKSDAGEDRSKWDKAGGQMKTKEPKDK